MLWEHDLIGECFLSFFKSSQTFKICPKLKRNNLNSRKKIMSNMTVTTFLCFYGVEEIYFFTNQWVCFLNAITTFVLLSESDHKWMNGP